MRMASTGSSFRIRKTGYNAANRVNIRINAGPVNIDLKDICGVSVAGILYMAAISSMPSSVKP